jgi:hypothetical protein
MILALRKRHRVIFCTMTVLLPVAFAAGLSGRRTVPVAASTPSVLHSGSRSPGRVIRTESDLWPGKRILTILRAKPAGSLTVEFMFKELAGPDVLVYWVAGWSLPGERLPDNAQLLGQLSNQIELTLPEKPEVGRFVLYSLADQEIVARSKPLNVPPVTSNP